MAESIDAISASASAAAAEVAQVAAEALQRVAASPSGRHLAVRRGTFRDSTAGELPPLDEDDAGPPATSDSHAGVAAADVPSSCQQGPLLGDAAARAATSRRGIRSASGGGAHGSTHSSTGSTKATGAAAAPQGALYMSVAMLRASTLKAHFAVSADPTQDHAQQSTMEGMAGVQALTRILHPWRGEGANVVEGQRGCLFVHVRAHSAFATRCATICMHCGMLCLQVCVHTGLCYSALWGASVGCGEADGWAAACERWMSPVAACASPACMRRSSGCERAAQVHKAWNLNIWSADGGFHGGSMTADAYDTYVQLRLASDEDETRTTVREERTRIVDNARCPEYNSEFEFLGQRVSQRLQLAVVVTRALEHGRLHSHVMGRASVVLDDLARCPNGKVRTSGSPIPLSHLILKCVSPQERALLHSAAAWPRCALVFWPSEV